MGRSKATPAVSAPAVEEDLSEPLTTDNVGIEDLEGYDAEATGEDDDDDDDLWDTEEEACMYCKCTESSACETPDGPCSWIAGDLAVCTNPECIAKHRAAGYVVEGFDEELATDEERPAVEVAVRDQLSAAAIATLPAKMRAKPIAAQSNAWVLSTIGRLYDEYVEGGIDGEAAAKDLAVLLAAAEQRDIVQQLGDGTIGAVRSLILDYGQQGNAAATEPTRDERPVEAYLGGRTLSGLSHKMRERPLHEQTLEWLLATIARITDEIIATRNNAGTRTEEEIVADLEILCQHAVAIGADHQLSKGTLSFAAAAIEKVRGPAPAASVEDDPNPPITEREATAPIGIAAALPGTPSITALVVELMLDRILIDLSQPRDEGADSDIGDEITSSTILPPIEVRRNPDPDANCPYILIDGERRYRGSRKAGRETIRAIVNDTPMDAGDLLLRQSKLNEGKKLKPMEEARTWKRIIEAKGWTAQQLAKAIHRPKSTISDRLALLDAPKQFLPLFERGLLSAAAAPIVRQLSELPARALDDILEEVQEDFDFEHAVRAFAETGKPVPVNDFEGMIDSALRSRLALIDPKTGADYRGKTAKVGDRVFAIDAEAYRLAVQKAAKPANRVEPSAAEKKYQAEEKKRREQQAAANKKAAAERDKKKRLYLAQFEAVAAKIPGAIDGKLALVLLAAWAEFGGWLDDEELAVLGVPPKKGYASKRLLDYAETLDSAGRIRLLVKMVIFRDQPPYREEDDFVAAAAKALKVDLSKVKVPDPVTAPDAAASRPALKKSAKSTKGQNRIEEAELVGCAGDVRSVAGLTDSPPVPARPGFRSPTPSTSRACAVAPAVNSSTPTPADSAVTGTSATSPDSDPAVRRRS